jgi:spore coat protein U-like protein
MKRVLFAALSVAALTMASSAAADTATGNLNVSATVNKSCSVGASSLSFGTISPATGVTTASPAAGSISVTCTFDTTYDVALNNGANFSGTRRMTNGTHFLNYDIYRNAAATQRFGATDVATDMVAGTGNGDSADSIPVYGLIPSGQAGTAGAGSYTDTVGITVTY